MSNLNEVTEICSSADEIKELYEFVKSTHDALGCYPMIFLNPLKEVVFSFYANCDDMKAVFISQYAKHSEDFDFFFSPKTKLRREKVMENICKALGKEQVMKNLSKVSKIHIALTECMMYLQ